VTHMHTFEGLEIADEPYRSSIAISPARAAAIPTVGSGVKVAVMGSPKRPHRELSGRIRRYTRPTLSDWCRAVSKRSADARY
jgi:hypothetical protein